MEDLIAKIILAIGAFCIGFLLLIGFPPLGILWFVIIGIVNKVKK